MKRTTFFVLKMILLAVVVACICITVYFGHSPVYEISKGFVIAGAMVICFILLLLAAAVEMKMSNVPKKVLEEENHAEG